MNIFGAASHILDRISSARKEKGQLVKKLAALEQKNDNSIVKHLNPKETRKRVKML